jgi:hypothetical protein
MAVLPEALRLLLEAAIRVGRPTVSWRLALARARPHLIEELLLDGDRKRVVAEVEAASAAVAEPMSAKEVEAALKEAWGERPGDVLDAFDPEPVAVTPTAQVHRGVLDGAPVAVKVARSRVAEQLRNDLSLADALMRPAGAAFPAADPAAVLREVRERVMEDVDLEHEAQAQRTLHRALRSHARFTVPAPITRLAGDRVLVSEWVDGAAPTADDAPDVLRLWVGSARAGTLHADPELDHVRKLPDGRLALLDCGATRRIDPARVDLAERALVALLDDDEGSFAIAVAELGWLDEADAHHIHAVARDLLAPFLHGPARLDVAALVDVRDRALERLDELWPLVRRGRLPPEDLWPLRMAGQLVVLLARLQATEDWLSLVRAALREGWAASEPAARST